MMRRRRDGYAPCEAESGQMSVELAVTLPIIIIMMVIAIDLMIFLGECARFDHIVPQQVIAQASSPPAGGYGEEAGCEAVRSSLSTQFAGPDEQVSVSVQGSGGALGFLAGDVVYTCRLELAPWPLAAGGVTLFGTTIPTALSHTCSFAIDPYDPAIL